VNLVQLGDKADLIKKGMASYEASDKLMPVVAAAGCYQGLGWEGLEWLMHRA